MNEENRASWTGVRSAVKEDWGRKEPNRCLRISVDQWGGKGGGGGRLIGFLCCKRLDWKEGGGKDGHSVEFVLHCSGG